MKLTKTTVANLPTPETGSAAHWDDSLPGFGVRVASSGRKTWVIRYRTQAGTDRLYTLARVADMLPEDARIRARELFVAVRQGADPARERSKAKEAPTVADLAQRVMTDHAKMKKPRTARAYDDLFRLWILPVIGPATPVTEITLADAERLRRKCGSRHTTANRALALLSKSLNLAERWGWRALNSNPVRHVERYRERKQERILSPEEIALVWQALDKACLMPSAVAFFRLLMLTGLRDSEWRTAMWSWLDVEGQALRLPDSKTGERVVALSPAAMDILRALPRASIYILPGLTGGPMKGQRKMWLRVLDIAGVGHTRIHDLRHTVGSYAHRAGATQREVADLLGHRQMMTAARYIHGPGSEKHKNAERAGAAILRMVGE